MRLIDADKLRLSYWVYPTSTGTISTADHYYFYSRAEVDNAPTIDAVPVVRCKDCKYMTEHYDTDGNVPYWTCSEWDSGTDYDGYCHYGERMDEANNE